MSWKPDPNAPFDIGDVPSWVPRRLKPWLFIVFVLVVQFSGGLYLAAASDMVGTTALMQEDILMAGYAQLCGMAINFAVMFRLKFRFTNRTGLLTCCSALTVCTLICAYTTNVALLVAVCFIAGWFRMWATFVCNSTIQLWITSVRDMSIFFCYVFLVVDGTIQVSGIAAVYSAFNMDWVQMHWLMAGLLVAVMILVVFLVRPFRAMPRLPLLGIDWIGAVLWGVFMLCFTFVCVYGDFYDWWESAEIVFATFLGLAAAGLNLWRATFLRHPYISLPVFTNRNVVRATMVYLFFYVMLATEHTLEHTYAAAVLGFDKTNMIDLNWYVFAGIVAGVALTYFTFAKRKTRYKTMTAIAFAGAAAYLAWFYFFLDYGVEKEALFVPLFIRGVASVVVTIVFLTSIVQSGLHFFVFPQALVVNGFTGAVMSATFGPALLGEWLEHIVADNAARFGSVLTASNAAAAHIPLGDLAGMVQIQAVAVGMKEIYGWLLIAALAILLLIAVSYGPIRPAAFQPTWKAVRRMFRATIPSRLMR